MVKRFDLIIKYPPKNVKKMYKFIKEKGREIRHKDIYLLGLKQLYLYLKKQEKEKNNDIDEDLDLTSLREEYIKIDE